MTMIVASSTARLSADRDRQTDLSCGRHELTADSPTDTSRAAAGPTPFALLTAALSTCTAMSVRTHLEQTGKTGDVAVYVDYDAGPPTLMHRSVELAVPLDEDAHRRLRDVLEDTPVTRLLRETLTIQTTLQAG